MKHAMNPNSNGERRRKQVVGVGRVIVCIYTPEFRVTEIADLEVIAVSEDVLWLKCTVGNRDAVKNGKTFGKV